MAKKQAKHENFDTVVAQATITATSNKSDGKYKQKKATKAVYLVPATEEDAQKLIDFGLQLYTPDTEKDPDARPYFIVKATENVKISQVKQTLKKLILAYLMKKLTQRQGKSQLRRRQTTKQKFPYMWRLCL